MEDYGLVSIITASYNSKTFIAETIESIQAQTYKNWELLITDDCSTDESCEIINQYVAKDNRIKLFKNSENIGAGNTRNNSIERAKGRFIAFCDSDDRWYPEKLERQLKFMLEKQCSLSYTSYDVCTEDGVIKGFVKCLPKLSYKDILRDNGIGCLTAIYDVKKIGKYYMSSIRKRQDWCLWIEIIKKTGPAYGLQETLGLYRLREGSISSNKIELLRHNYNVYNKVLGYSSPISILLLYGYFLPYYFYKKIKQKLDYKKHKQL